jgi:hypothetical protein
MEAKRTCRARRARVDLTKMTVADISQGVRRTNPQAQSAGGCAPNAVARHYRVLLLTTANAFEDGLATVASVR